VTSNNFRLHETDDLSESDKHKVVWTDRVLRQWRGTWRHRRCVLRHAY